MQLKQEIYPLQGMICRQCEDIVCRKLLTTRGVLKAEASYWKGTATVDYDSDIITSEHICIRLEQCGYPVRKKARGAFLFDVIYGVLLLTALILLHALPLPAIPAVNNGTSYGMVFLCGLVTSTHCIVMCGGIVLSQTSGALMTPERRRLSFFSAFNYHLGRVAVCTLLGAFWGAAGTAITYTVKMKSFAFTIAGTAVTLVGLQMWGVLPWLRKLSIVLPAPCGLYSKFVKKKRPLLIGILTGIMPCSASYAMWLVAATAGSTLQGLLTMLIWSLGTVPLMFLFAIFGTLLPKSTAKWMMKLNVSLLIFLGLKMIMNGIQLFIML